VSNQPKPCFVCSKGSLLHGKRFFIETDSFYECDHCHSQFHRQENRTYLFKNIPDGNSWKKYEGSSLSEEEIKRIRTGGLSDAEIAKQREQEEERKRREQTPGTPENYRLRARNILGMAEGDTEFVLQIEAKSPEEVKQYINNITQMQKELKQLKKEINVNKKDIRADFAARKVQVNTSFSGSSRYSASLRAREKETLDVLRSVEMDQYDDVIAMIDLAIVNLDRGKVEIQNQAIGLTVKGKSSTAPKSSGKRSASKQSESAKGTEKSLEELFLELNGLIGLNSIKSEVQELANFLKVQQVRKSRGLPATGLSLHVVFYGNPGTGKTTVARLLSEIYKALGVLGTGQLVETDRSSMVAGYVGQTALKVTDVVAQALGGILFIDEAYSLASEDGEDYGREAIDTLIKLMEDHRSELAVVIAGYTEKIEKFLTMNPGLKSRFNRYWKFEDYTSSELLEIFNSFCAQGHFQLSVSARDKLKITLQAAYENRDETFGNARLARNLYESSISNQANRIVRHKQISDEALTTLEAEDIPNAVEGM
jgi:SpoVK/Ycf46/Vps4 family AAA+-type ATPase